jgi:hypothetical protein
VSADLEGQGTNSGPTLTHTQCINRLQEIRDAMSQIAELKSPSDEDDAYFGELRDEFDRTDAWRKTLERNAELERVRSAASGLSASRHLRSLPGAFGGTQSSGNGYDRDAFLEPDSIESVRFRNPWDLSEVRTWGRSREEVNAEYRARAISAIEKMPVANDKVRSAATDIVERFDDKDATLARLALVASSPEYMRAFSKAATNRLHELSHDETRALEQTRAMSLTDSAGGYLVPFQLDPTVIVTANGSRNDIRMGSPGRSSPPATCGTVSRRVRCRGRGTRRARRCPTTPRRSRSPPSPSTRRPGSSRSPSRRCRTRPTAPGGRDAPRVRPGRAGGGGVHHRFRLRSAHRHRHRPRRFLLGDQRGTDDVFALGDVYTIQGALPARHRKNASWLANNLIYSRIRQFDTSGGGGFWTNLVDGPAAAAPRARRARGGGDGRHHHHFRCGVELRADLRELPELRHRRPHRHDRGVHSAPVPADHRWHRFRAADRAAWLVRLLPGPRTRPAPTVPGVSPGVDARLDNRTGAERPRSSSRGRRSRSRSTARTWLIRPSTPVPLWPTVEEEVGERKGMQFSLGPHGLSEEAQRESGQPLYEAGGPGSPRSARARRADSGHAVRVKEGISFDTAWWCAGELSGGASCSPLATRT